MRLRVSRSLSCPVRYVECVAQGADQVLLPPAGHLRERVPTLHTSNMLEQCFGPAFDYQASGHRLCETPRNRLTALKMRVCSRLLFAHLLHLQSHMAQSIIHSFTAQPVSECGCASLGVSAAPCVMLNAYAGGRSGLVATSGPSARTGPNVAYFTCSTMFRPCI